MRTRITIIFGILVLSTLGVTGTAGAQQHIESVGQWKNPVGASVGNLINDRLWVRVRAKSKARAKARPSALAKAPAKRINPAAPVAPTAPVADTEVTASKTSPQVDAAVRFRPTGTQLRTQAITDLLSANADETTKKGTFTLVSALLTEYEKEARKQGQPNDLALAITVALVYNSCIYNGTPEPSDERIMEIRDALAELIAEKGIFTPFSDLQKQELYENLVITTLLAKVGYEETKKSGDTTSMAAYRGLAGITLQAVSGMPPEKVNLAAQFQDLDSDAETTGPAPADNAEYFEYDPFPDKPYVQAQKPLLGRLRKTITTADLAGKWELGAASVTTYFSGGNYSSTDTSFFGETYTIRPDGSFISKFQGRSSNTTIRESDSGTISLSGSFIIIKGRQTTKRYQFVSYMTQPNGAAVLTLIFIGDSAPLDFQSLQASCGHANGYITCVTGENWVRLEIETKPVNDEARPNQLVVLVVGLCDLGAIPKSGIADHARRIFGS